jgi:hypothetical protein
MRTKCVRDECNVHISSIWDTVLQDNYIWESAAIAVDEYPRESTWRRPTDKETQGSRIYRFVTMV